MFNYFFTFAKIKPLQFANLWQFLIQNESENLRAKWLNIGIPTAYSKDGVLIYPIDNSILSKIGLLEKSELQLSESKEFISDSIESLTGCADNFNRIGLNGNYIDSVGYIVLNISISLSGLEHFYTAITTEGLILDKNGTVTGQLTNADCILVTTASNFRVDNGIFLSGDFTCLGDVTLFTNNDHDFTPEQNGKLYNLSFTDTYGNIFNFPCVELYQTSEYTYLLHGTRIDFITGVSTKAFLFADNISFDKQNSFFWQVQKGVDLTTGSDLSKIWIPKNSNKESNYSTGLSGDTIPIAYNYNDNNEFDSIAQNATESGFNEFAEVKYMPNPNNEMDLTSVGITNLTEWSYADLIDFINNESKATADVDSNGLITNFKILLQTSGLLTENLLIKHETICGYENKKYIKWLNSNGCWEYELFDEQIIENNTVSNTDNYQIYNSDTLTANESILTVGGDVTNEIELNKQNIQKYDYYSNQKYDNSLRYLDLQQSAKLNDLWVLNCNFTGQFVINDLNGLCRVVCNEPHKLKNGDYIYLKNTEYDANTEYYVNYINDYEFYINLDFQIANDNTGSFQKKIVNTDWLRYNCKDCDVTIDNTLNIINVSMKITSKNG